MESDVEGAVGAVEVAVEEGVDEGVVDEDVVDGGTPTDAGTVLS